MKIANIIHLTNEAEIKPYRDELAKQIDAINQRVYSSLTEERLRVAKLFTKFTIPANIDIVWKEIMQQIVLNLGDKLSIETIVKDGYYLINDQHKKLVFHIVDYEPKQIIAIEWLANNQYFQRTFKIRQTISKKKTKIYYFDLVKGKTSILGYFENRIKNVYLKKQLYIFQIQMQELMLKLNLIPQAKVDNKKAYINKLRNKIGKLF